MAVWLDCGWETCVFTVDGCVPLPVPSIIFDFIVLYLYRVFFSDFSCAYAILQACWNASLSVFVFICLLSCWRECACVSICIQVSVTNRNQQTERKPSFCLVFFIHCFYPELTCVSHFECVLRGWPHIIIQGACRRRGGPGASWEPQVKASQMRLSQLAAPQSHFPLLLQESTFSSVAITFCLTHTHI